MSEAMDFGHRIIRRVVKPLTPPPVDIRAFEVHAVHPFSIAAAAGIRPGMALILPSGRAKPWQLPERNARGPLTTHFIDVAAGEIVELETDGFPFGARLAPTPAAIARAARMEPLVLRDAVALIHETGEDTLVRIADALVAERDPPRMLSRFLGGRKPGYADPYKYDLVDQVIIGAAAAATGEIDRAQSFYMMLRALSPVEHGRIVEALYFYGMARLVEAENGPPDEVAQLLEAALASNPDSAMIRARLGLTAAMAPAPHVGQQFPTQYELRAHDPLDRDPPPGPATWVSLADTLARLGPDEMLVIISLGEYRANGYYSHSLSRLAELHDSLARHFPVLHVITSYVAGMPHNEAWMDGEMAARAAGVPLSILCDPTEVVPQALASTGSPHNIIVDRTGWVVYEGALMHDHGFFEALAKVAVR